MSKSIYLPKSITCNFDNHLIYVNSLPTLSHEEEVSLFKQFQVIRKRLCAFDESNFLNGGSQNGQA